MSFLQGAFLAATAFAAIPLLLHLLTRRRLQDVALPSYMFLLSSKRRSLKILTVNQWLLLALRVALLAALALAFAMPVAEKLNVKIPGAASPSRIAIIIDNTPSMTRSEGGVSIFDRAASAANKIIKNGSAQDEISVVPLCGDEFFPGARGEVSGAPISELKISACGETISDKIKRVTPGLKSSPYSDKRIVVISDFQSGSVSAGAATGTDGAVRVIAVDMAPAKTVPDAWPENISMPAFPLKGEEVSICVDVKFSEGGGGSTQVALFLDGAKRGEQNIEPAEGATTAKPCFSLSFSETGSHVLSAVLTGDSFTYNNSTNRIFEVGSSIPVGLVGDERQFSDPGSDTFYLLRALRAVSGAVPGEKIAVITTYATGELEKAAAAEKVIVIPGETALTGPQIALLATFISGGGGVFLTTGIGDDNGLIASGLFGNSIMISKAKEASSSDTYANATDIDASHEIFKNKSGKFITADLMTSRFSKTARIEALNPETRTVASLSGGTVLLGERRVGNGAVIISATPFNTDATNFSLKPSFVPFILQIVKYLSNSYHEDVDDFFDGEKIRLRFDSTSTAITATNAMTGGAAELKKSGTDAEGLYSAKGLAPGVYKAIEGNAAKNFIVSPYPGELDLSKTGKEALAALVGSDANIIDASKNLDEEALLEKTFSRKKSALWFAFFGLATILMLAEGLVANRA